MKLNAFNQLSDEKALADLLQCCHCPSWAKDLVRIRPYINVQALLQQADDRWQETTEEERLAAFAAHPQIGDLSALREKFSFANREQGQITEANEEVLLELQKKNQEYLDKFGFIFIICATGKTADYMLAQLQNRMVNSRDQEIENAATEQQKITALRLKKYFEECERR